MDTVYLIRYNTPKEGGVLGKMMFGNQVLYTLEPSFVNPAHEGHPCIDEGCYGLAVSKSPKFKRVLPEVLGVSGRSGIRIHSGDSVMDTEGCIIPFRISWPTGRGTSKASEAFFTTWLTSRLKGGKVWLKVINDIRG